MKLLTIDEVADILQMHTESVRRKCRKGELPCIKVGRHWRVRKEDLNEWLNEQRN